MKCLRDNKRVRWPVSVSQVREPEGVVVSALDFKLDILQRRCILGGEALNISSAYQAAILDENRGELGQVTKATKGVQCGRHDVIRHAVQTNERTKWRTYIGIECTPIKKRF